MVRRAAVPRRRSWTGGAGVIKAALTQEQHEVRRTGIGASEIAAVAGIDPYRRPIDVWAEKLGLVEPFAGNRYTKWGSLLEAVIADSYAEDNGVVLTSPGTLRHPQHEIVLATPDRLVHPSVNAPPVRNLQIKCSDARNAEQWGEGPDDVPEQYLCQVTWEMAVTGLPETDLAVLIGGNEDRVYRIRRDLELEGQLIEVAEKFWRDHVLTQDPPPVDGTEQYGNYLKCRFPRDARPLLPATQEACDLVDQLRFRRAALAAAVEAEAEIENRIKALISDAAGIEGLVTWKAAKPSTKTDHKQVAEQLQPYVKSDIVQKIITQYTTTKPGSRRFLLAKEK